MFNKIIKKIKCFPKCKILGAVLIVSGLVLLLCFLPGWAWGAILGIILVACGIYLLTL